MRKISDIVRVVVFASFVISLALLCGISLMKIQIVMGETYLAESDKSLTATQDVKAARGTVIDSNGVLLSGNKVVYKIIVQNAFFPAGEENEIINKTLKLLKNNDTDWIDTIPISKEQPYSFLPSREADIEDLKRRLNLNTYATVDNCMDALITKYGLQDYSPQEQRNIAGVRYEMLIMDFSFANKYVLADDVPISTVMRIKELSFILKGLDVVEESARTYDMPDTAPHVLGTIGPISAAEYARLKEDGYKLNDTIGKDGIEKAMESELRGESGTRTIVKKITGEVISDEITKEVTPGNTVMLTIDSRFQKDLQDMLANHINWLVNTDSTKRAPDAFAGSIVVLDVKTGAVLGMANFPTYNLNDYIADYTAVLNAEDNPLYNRAINGLYRPGSTFKTITSIAGLTSGTINSTSTVYCGGKYTFYRDYQPNCFVGPDGYIDVRNALRVSCNIFFYDIARRMGIDMLSNTAENFGFGTDLGLEIGGSTGRMSGIETYESMGLTWTPGDTLQAAIGQLETYITPLHLAVQAMTLANSGIRYRPYLVKAVYDYSGENLIYETQPEVAYDFGNEQEHFKTVQEGMKMVADNVRYNGLYFLRDIGMEVAIKTGTPQLTETLFNSALVGYAPYDDPQIAFGIILEQGEYSRHLVKHIVESYFFNNYFVQFNQEGHVITP